MIVFCDHCEQKLRFPQRIEVIKYNGKFIVILDNKEKHIYPFIKDKLCVAVYSFGKTDTQIRTNAPFNHQRCFDYVRI